MNGPRNYRVRKYSPSGKFEGQKRFKKLTIIKFQCILKRHTEDERATEQYAELHDAEAPASDAAVWHFLDELYNKIVSKREKLRYLTFT